MSRLSIQAGPKASQQPTQSETAQKTYAARRYRSASASTEAPTPADGLDLSKLALFPPVQCHRVSSAPISPEFIKQAAAKGTQGPCGPLPYLSQIQRSFGRYDVGEVKAFTSDTTEQAARSMGAAAFATGESVGFGSAPTLFHAAHEAAHVIQQRSGASIPGGVGQANDPLEQNADAVARRVVAGHGAEDLLGAITGGGKQLAQPSGSSHSAPVQRAIFKDDQLIEANDQALQKWLNSKEFAEAVKAQVQYPPNWANIDDNAKRVEFREEYGVATVELYVSAVRQKIRTRAADRLPYLIVRRDDAAPQNGAPIPNAAPLPNANAAPLPNANAAPLPNPIPAPIVAQNQQGNQDQQQPQRQFLIEDRVHNFDELIPIACKAIKHDKKNNRAIDLGIQQQAKKPRPMGKGIRKFLQNKQKENDKENGLLDDDAKDATAVAREVTPELLKQLLPTVQAIAQQVMAKSNVVNEKMFSSKDDDRYAWNDEAVRRSKVVSGSSAGSFGARLADKQYGRAFVGRGMELMSSREESYLQCCESASVILYALSECKELEGIPVYAISQGDPSQGGHWYVFIGDPRNYDPGDKQGTDMGIVVDIWGANSNESVAYAGNKNDIKSYQEVKDYIVKKEDKVLVNYPARPIVALKQTEYMRYQVLPMSPKEQKQLKRQIEQDQEKRWLREQDRLEELQRLELKKQADEKKKQEQEQAKVKPESSIEPQPQKNDAEPQNQLQADQQEDSIVQRPRVLQRALTVRDVFPPRKQRVHPLPRQQSSRRYFW